MRAVMGLDGRDGMKFRSIAAVGILFLPNHVLFYKKGSRWGILIW